MRPNICGRNAAMVSALMFGAVTLVTSRPSFIASNAPETPGRRAAFATISFAPKCPVPLPMTLSRENCAGAGAGAEGGGVDCTVGNGASDGAVGKLGATEGTGVMLRAEIGR